MNSFKCPTCGLVDWATATECRRCRERFGRDQVENSGDTIPEVIPAATQRLVDSPNTRATSTEIAPAAPFVPSTPHVSHEDLPVRRRSGLAIFSLVAGI